MTRDLSRLLIVEDEPDLRTMLRLVFELENFDVIDVETGEEGLERASDADLILLDVRLPGIDGLTVLERLPPDMRSRVLVMSAHADAEYGDRALAGGSAGFIQKPFRTATIVQRVRQLVTSLS